MQSYVCISSEDDVLIEDSYCTVIPFLFVSLLIIITRMQYTDLQSRLVVGWCCGYVHSNVWLTGGRGRGEGGRERGGKKWSTKGC